MARMLTKFAMARKSWRYWTFFLIASICAATGCVGNDSPPAPKAAGPSRVARTEHERGPVKISVEVSPNPARLSDEPTMTLTMEYELGVVLEKPPFGEAVGDFVIRNIREPLPEVRDGREIVRQIYTLEPMQAGLSHVDPITVRFTDNRPKGDGKVHEIESDPLPLNIVSEITDVPSLASLKGYAGPRELPRESLIWPWTIAGLLVMGLIIGFIWVRRRKQLLPPPALTPVQQATNELDSLRRVGMHPEDAKNFYVELTGIVRRFIERTTGIHAPEQTTEEFLHEIGRGQTFAREDRQRLKDFLEAADLVKFAAHQPVAADMEESFRRAQTFIGLIVHEAAA